MKILSLSSTKEVLRMGPVATDTVTALLAGARGGGGEVGAARLHINIINNTLRHACNVVLQVGTSDAQYIVGISLAAEVGLIDGDKCIQIQACNQRSPANQGRLLHIKDGANAPWKK